MEMMDMKRPKPPKKGVHTGNADTIDAPSYKERPYCMRFTLEGPELEKMGMKPSDFADMQPMMMQMECEPINIRDISSKSENAYDKERNHSVEFQINKLGMGEMKKKMAGKMRAYNEENKKGPGE